MTTIPEIKTGGRAGVDTKEAAEYLAAKNVDNVRLVVTDLMGMARGKRVPVKKFLKACEEGISFYLPYYGFTIDSEQILNLPIIGAECGLPDGAMWPDLDTLTVLPWDERTAWVMCDMRTQAGDEVPWDPRTLLRRQIAECGRLGVQPVVGIEYECYVLNENQQSVRAKRWRADEFDCLFEGGACYDQVRLGRAGPLMKDIWRHLEGAGVALDSFHIELGGGHLEFPAKEAPALTAADRAVLLKVGVKEVCYQHGLMATFMAKIDSGYQGLSGAVHHSLLDEAGANVFYDAERPHHLSETFDYWCEGLLENLCDMTLLFLPNFNSYKRPVPGSYVGNTTTWGLESRSTTFRAINFDPKATRIEARIGGADASPYLATAAILAAGIHGLHTKAPLRPAFVGCDPAMDDQGRSDVEAIPASLESAIARFRGSRRMSAFFGDEFCELFAAHRQNDLDWFGQRVSDLERARYLEYV